MCIRDRISGLREQTSIQLEGGGRYVSSMGGFFRKRMILAAQFALDRLALFHVINTTYSLVLLCTESVCAPQRWLASSVFPQELPPQPEASPSLVSTQSISSEPDVMLLDSKTSKDVARSSAQEVQEFEDNWANFFDS
eukprot:TRINITY_DN11903_c0_g1_i1.p1 TRINITY_DN11903_c0_g1~~TRINITY_DN11903_c0_g1_i1.p1  ORF type:complete len:138 (+),score=28.20 TRINITY_DN11903_c0_g1_i1:80-493(+)